MLELQNQKQQGHKGDLRIHPIQSLQLQMRMLRFGEVNEPFKVLQSLQQSWDHTPNSLAV